MGVANEMKRVNNVCVERFIQVAMMEERVKGGEKQSNVFCHIHLALILFRQKFQERERF